MANHVGELDNGDTGLELLDDKRVAKIIHFGAFNSRDTEVTIDGGTDIADQEWVTGLCDKEGRVFSFWALTDVFLDRGFGGRV